MLVELKLVSLLIFMLYYFLRKSTTEQQCSSLKNQLSSQLFSNGYLRTGKEQGF